MAKILYFCSFFVIVVLFNSSRANQCIQKNPCMCEFDEYTQINLTHLLPSDKKFINDTQGDYTYFFSGCKDQLFKASDYYVNSTQSFNASLVKCIQTIVPVEKNNSENAFNISYICSAIGSSTQLKYDSTDGYQIIYKDTKKNSLPSIQLLCVNNKHPDLKIENYEVNELTLYSSSVCIQHISHHELSTGSIFCILFFTVAFLYFVGGGIIMYTARGARGVEVIPNFEFWASLPALMRDGMVFILSGCRPFTVATAETYDRI